MSKRKNKIVGKIGFCDNKTLGIKNADGSPLEGGHYVYIREVKKNKCKVNVVTSLEDKKHRLNQRKLYKVKHGFVYPIPKKDANFNRWSAIDLSGNIKDIPQKDIKQIGNRSIKRRHKTFINRFTKQ